MFCLGFLPSDAVMIQEDRVYCPEINFMEISKNKRLITDLKNIADFQAKDDEIKLIMDIVNRTSNRQNGRLSKIAKRLYIKSKSILRLIPIKMLYISQKV